MRIITAIIGVLAIAAGTCGARAQIAELTSASPLVALETADDSRGWDAVGRLNFGDRGFCTGALIAPDLVLTAGHCLFEKTSGRPFAPSEITFLAGWRDGRAEAYRGVRRAMAHPDYVPRSTSIGAISEDLALIELDRPIRNSRIQPFAVHAGPRAGDAVGIVSYARERADRASLQELCHVMARQEGALVMSCSVDFGASGAPVFVFTEAGPQIVSVVSAMAEMQDKRVSLGTGLGGSLDALQRAMAAGDGVFHRAQPEIRRISRDESLKSGSAKFLRP